MPILDFQRPDKVSMIEADDKHGVFEFRPLEPGYGITIGNSLRRILLSSLEGFAITSVRIDGVEHEFSTIKGVIEDAGDASKYVPEFAVAASALKKPGDVSAPVKTSYGFHVIKLMERTSDKPASFAEMKDQIVSRLRSEYIEKQVRTFTDTLRNLPIDANADLVASLRTRFGDAQKIPAEGAEAAQ